MNSRVEPERPKVDGGILEFVKSHRFHAADFVIRTDGVCRLNREMARGVAQVVRRALV
jgi:CRISP-associated protein Cas1